MKRKQFPTIDLKTASWANGQCYCIDDKAYAVEDLWEAAKDLPTYEVPLIGFMTDIEPWSETGDSFHEFMRHVKLTNDADMSYPIILDPRGDIADGRHRLAKAIVDGHSTIKIKRLSTMPEPKFIMDDDGNVEAA